MSKERAFCYNAPEPTFDLLATQCDSEQESPFHTRNNAAINIWPFLFETRKSMSTGWVHLFPIQRRRVSAGRRQLSCLWSIHTHN
jgi:hypothetical protein